MANRTLIVMLSCLALLTGCGGEGGERAHAPEILRAVPSDALALVCSEKCGRGLESALDSTDLLRRIDLGHLGGERAVISSHNLGSVEHLLTIDAGRASDDTSSHVREVISRADELGLASLYICGSDSTIRRNLLLLSPSKTVITVAGRHVSSGTSILDAPGFGEALNAAAGMKEVMFFRNSGAEKIFTYKGLDSFFPHRTMTSFLHSAAGWTVVDASDAGDGSFTATTVQDASTKYFANMAGGLEPARPALGEILPEAVLAAVDMPIASLQDFRSAYESWRDAGSSLTAYGKALKSLRSASGKDPLSWEKEVGVREVARVFMDCGSVSLVRVRKHHGATTVSENPYSGFVGALYGDAFASPCDSCVIGMGEWIVTGSRPAVEAFSSSPALVRDNWPKSCGFAVYGPSLLMWSNKFDISLTVNSI